MNKQFEPKYQFEPKNQQSSWTKLSTIIWKNKTYFTIWTEISTITLNRNIKHRFWQKCQQSILQRFQQIIWKTELSIWTEIWTINSNKNMNNQFEPKCEFKQKYRNSIWQNLSTFFLKKTIHTNHIEQKQQQSISTKLSTINFEPKN